MNSYKDFCKNACDMDSWHDGQAESRTQYIAMPVHLTKRLWLFKVADMSISKSFKLRTTSSISMQYILSSFIWQLKVFIVSFNHAFQLKIPLVIIFKLA